MVRLFFLLIVLAVPAAAQVYKCLPADVAADRVVSTSVVPDGAGRSRVEKITVQQVLGKLGATCRGTRLVDRNRKEIRFYRLQGCWGNPPQNYLEILDRQRSDLANLRKKFNVVELTCNPSGLDIP